MNMTPENRAHFESKKEAIHLILTRIGDEIYSTVDACQTAQEMWEAIKRLQQGESLNIQDVKTNLFWEFGQFTSHDGETIESYYTRFYKMMNEMIRNNLTVATMQVNVQFLQQLQPEWSRFVTIVKQQHKLDEVSYHKLFDILKQYQKEVNELPSLPTRSHATTRYKGKEIAKPITPPSESAFEEDNDPEQAQKDKDMQKNLALIAKYFKKLYKPTNNNLRTSSNTRNKNVDTTPRYKNDNQTGQFGNQRAMNVVRARETIGGPVVQQFGIQCFNCKEFGHYAKECRKPKRVKDSTYHKEKMMLCKQAEKGVQYDTDNNVFANDIQHFEQSESISNTCAVETGDSNVTPDSPDMCDNDIQDDQNDVECDDERVALANLIANLKLDVDENKKIQKQLKKANATLTQELTECKSILAETSRTLGESNSIRDSCLVALQNKQTEFERFKAFNDRTVDYDKLERRLNETLGLLAQKEIDIKEGLKVKAYEISVVKEKHDELVKQSLLTKSHYEGLVKEKTKVITDLKLKEEKDIDKMISMENQKPKWVKDSTYHKEKMLLCKQAEKGVQLQAEQSDSLADTDEEINEQEFEAHYSYMEKIQEDDQNDVECDDERVALANLIANLKHDVDENKKIQKQLKKANATLTQELTECKSILAETSRTLGESNSIRDSCLIALQNKQTEFERFKAFNDRTVDYDKLE
ncbi:retrovirus-related pol polyprotein from transposon TNT 1-94 [Tanacetum coccineum]